MSKKSAPADGRTPVSETPVHPSSDSDLHAAKEGGIETARFREVAELVDCEFDRYRKLRESLRARFAECRRSVVAKNPN